MRSLGNSSLLRFVVVWERRRLCYLNKPLNCNPELFLCLFAWISATNGLNAICIVMWLRITWTRHRIAWIMFGGGGAHYVPWDVKSASLEHFVSAWTVRHQIWSDSLTRISTDVLLFRDINLSLIHHYRVHKRGLPHIAFRKDYLTRL